MQFIRGPSVDILCGRPPDHQQFQPKIGTPATPDLGNVYTDVGFSTPFRFRVRKPYVTNNDVVLKKIISEVSAAQKCYELVE